MKTILHIQVIVIHESFVARFGGILENLGPVLISWFPQEPLLEQLDLAFNYTHIIIQWLNNDIPATTDGESTFPQPLTVSRHSRDHRR